MKLFRTPSRTLDLGESAPTFHTDPDLMVAQPAADVQGLISSGPPPAQFWPWTEQRPDAATQCCSRGFVSAQLQVVNQLDQAVRAIAREVCTRLGWERPRIRQLVAAAIIDARNDGVELNAIENAMVRAYREMVDTRPVGMAPYSSKRFFGEGLWRSPDRWRWFNAHDRGLQLVLPQPAAAPGEAICSGCGATYHPQRHEFFDSKAWCVGCHAFVVWKPVEPVLR